MVMQRSAGLILLIAPLVSSFSYPATWSAHEPATRPGQLSSLALCSSVDGAARTSRVHAGPDAPIGLSMQMPDAPIKIPDTFNPAEWSRKGSGGGGGFSIPDSFNPEQYGMEKERGGRATAVLDRPADSKTDPGKKYRVLLFNDNNNTRQFVVEVLMKYIPNMTQEMAKEITMRAHNTGMAVVGVWMLEIAEGYSTILNENGLKSDIEED